MAKFQKFSSFIILSLICAQAMGQTQDSYDYTSEFTWGINKNTYGGLIGGLMFKKAKKRSERILATYGLEIVNIKHPQEVRRSASTGSGNQYIYGKTNYLYAFRFQYGRDIILFKKAPQQGAEIKAVFAIGPTLGLLAPYYVQIRSGSGSSDVRVYKQYDPKTVQISEIDGPGRIFQGIDKSDVKLGLNLKAAINFELGTIKSQVTGFEAGFLLDSYAGNIELMSAAKNYSVFPTLFIAIFYGSRK
jgi:hypothetical protein